MARRQQGHFNVAPRYTPGSPAMVDEATARRVGEEERDAITGSLDGLYGEEERQRAEREGLKGIAEYRKECRGHWLVDDLITGELFQRPFDPMKPVIRRCDRCVAQIERRDRERRDEEREEFTDTARGRKALDDWARRHDDLNGAPEDESDR